LRRWRRWWYCRAVNGRREATRRHVSDRSSSPTG